MVYSITSIVCKVCGTTKSVEEAPQFFYTRSDKDPSTKSYWNTTCKACIHLRGKRRREANKSEISIKKAEYAKKNKERISAYKKKYYQEVGKFKNKEQYEKHKEKRKAVMLKKRIDNAISDEHKQIILHKRWVNSLGDVDRFLYDRIKIAQVRAKKFNLDFDLEFDFIKELLEKQNRVCYYSGIPLEFQVNAINATSLDRIDSRLGYLKSNIVWSAKYVNLAKNNLELEDFIGMCRNVSNNFSN